MSCVELVWTFVFYTRGVIHIDESVVTPMGQGTGKLTRADGDHGGKIERGEFCSAGGNYRRNLEGVGGGIVAIKPGMRLFAAAVESELMMLVAPRLWALPSWNNIRNS